MGGCHGGVLLGLRFACELSRGWVALAATSGLKEDRMPEPNVLFDTKKSGVGVRLRTFALRSIGVVFVAALTLSTSSAQAPMCVTSVTNTIAFDQVRNQHYVDFVNNCPFDRRLLVCVISGSGKNLFSPTYDDRRASGYIYANDSVRIYIGFRSTDVRIYWADNGEVPRPCRE